MAIATALRAAEAAKRAAERGDDAERPLQRIGNGWSLKPADQAPRRPIRDARSGTVLRA